MVTAEAAYCALGAANTRVHCLPTTLGIDHRIINGRVYIGGNAVTDPAEIARRTAEFQQRAFYYYENWETLYAQWKREDAGAHPRGAGAAEARVAGIRAAGARACRAGHCRQSLPPRDLPATLEGYFRMWHHHFEFLLLGYGAYLTFFAFCKKAFPEITDQTVARMVAGMEAEIFRPDEELRRLARRAVELGVDAQFQRRRAGRERHPLARAGRPARDSEWLRELAASARSLVQHQRRRRLLSLSPLLER